MGIFIRWRVAVEIYSNKGFEMMDTPSSVIDTIFFISENVNKGGVQLFEVNETNIPGLSSSVSGDCATKINIDSFAYLLQHLLNSKPNVNTKDGNDNVTDIPENFSDVPTNVKKVFYIARSENSSDELYIVKDESQERLKESDNISKHLNGAKKVPKDDIIMLINSLLGDSKLSDSMTGRENANYEQISHNDMKSENSINNNSKPYTNNVYQNYTRNVNVMKEQDYNNNVDNSQVRIQGQAPVQQFVDPYHNKQSPYESDSGYP